jgi:hypothetical protein
MTHILSVTGTESEKGRGSRETETVCSSGTVSGKHEIGSGTKNASVPQTTAIPNVLKWIGIGTVITE